MTRLLPIAGLCFAASALCATSWAPLAVPGATRYLADAGSLHADHGAATVMDISVLTEFPQALDAAFDPQLHYRSTITNYRIDCTNRYAWVLGVGYYGSDAGQGRPLKHYAFGKPQRQDIVSWGSLDSIAKYACKNVGAASEPPRLEDMRPTIIHDTRRSRYATAPQQ